MPGRPRLTLLIGVGLVAGTTVALQVLLTRLFSAELFYHFGFLALSLALLGVGGGAVLLYVRPQWFDRRSVEATMARWTVIYAVLLVIATAVLVRLDYAYDSIDAQFTANMAVACVLAAAPFMAAGLVIALAVRAYVASIGRVYAIDLAGAGLGAAIVVPLMWVVAVPTLIVALAACAAIAALLFAPAGRERTLAAGATGVAGLCVVLAATTSAFYLVPNGPKPDAERWTPLSRVLGYAPPDTGRGNGLVIYDRVIGEIIPYRGGAFPSWRRTQEGPQSIGFAITGPGNALIIGGGGGRDIVNALGLGQRVDVIELNRGIRDLVDEDLGDRTGRPYSLPGVTTRIGDGRSTLARSDKRYDQIQIGFTDTFSANSGQAFALTEANLYTVEAYQEYLDHLRPNGILNVARPIRHSGAEALRATLLALEALQREGVKNPADHVVVIRGAYNTLLKQFIYGTVLTKRTPFTAAEVRQIRRLAQERGLGVDYAPGGPYRGDWAKLAAAESPQAFCDGFRLNVCPPTDDKPFFFFAKRLSDIGGASTSATIGVPDPLEVLAVLLGILAVLCGAAFLLPLFLVRSEGRPGLRSLSFFAFIGVGFMLLEVVLVQRFVLFLGFPTYALSVVLAAMLIATGLGALWSGRARRAPRRWLLTALGVACAIVAAMAFGLQPLLRGMIDLPFGARVGVTIALIAPLAVALGMAMPLGLQRLSALHPSGVPWAWGINGVASVFASVLAILLAINFGYAVTTLAALAMYLLALAHAWRGRWPAPEHGGSEAPAPVPVDVDGTPVAPVGAR